MTPPRAPGPNPFRVPTHRANVPTHRTEEFSSARCVHHRSLTRCGGDVCPRHTPVAYNGRHVR